MAAPIVLMGDRQWETVLNGFSAECPLLAPSELSRSGLPLHGVHNLLVSLREVFESFESLVIFCGVPVRFTKGGGWPRITSTWPTQRWLLSIW
jgi:hypothetical protein